jgi:hypothetical protein
VCWFITIGVPRASRHHLERAEREQPSLSFWFLDSTPTTDLFGPDHDCVQISRDGCSCSLVFTPPEDPEKLLEKQRVRLRKKGLSESKIERAIQDKSHALSKKNPISGDTVIFNAVVSSLVKSSAGVRLYRHFYKGNQNSQAVPPPATATISLGELESGGFPPDSLVTVRAEA